MSLDEIINDEYSVNIIMNGPFMDKAENILQNPSEENNVMSALADLEYWAFTQGFLRGIAAVKGGAV